MIIYVGNFKCVVVNDLGYISRSARLHDASNLSNPWQAFASCGL